MAFYIMIAVTLGLLTVSLGQTTQAPGDYEDAIFVSRDTNVNGEAIPVHLPRVMADFRSMYDNRASRFYAFQDGVYWVSVSAGAKPGCKVNYSLWKDKNRIADIYRDSHNNNGNDTLDRTLIVKMKIYESLLVQSREQAGLFSNSGRQTSLAAFRLTGMMRNPVYFCVARNTSVSGNQESILRFPTIIENEGLGFDPSKGYFVAPTSGIYHFSISAGIKRRTRFEINMRKGIPVYADLLRESSTHDGIDTISRTFTTILKENDTIIPQLETYSNAYSDYGIQTSFSGFLYDPVHGQKEAWSVARNTSWLEPLLSPVPFNDVIVDEGGDWNSIRNVFRVTIPGYYYIAFTAGAVAFIPVDFRLVKTGQSPTGVMANILRTSTAHNGIDIMSRSLVLHLQAGDELFMQKGPDTAVYSSPERQTTFSGFFLFPE